MKAKTMRRIYLREATVMLVVARLAVRFVPPARVFAWASRPPRRIHRFAVEEIGWVSWAVETIGAKRWMNAASLPRALAAQTMLRRRGIASRLCLGVAHAWIQVGRNKRVVGAEAERFTPLAEFGGASR
jgi:Transglutaminase-like superfamily